MLNRPTSGKNYATTEIINTHSFTIMTRMQQITVMK